MLKTSTMPDALILLRQEGQRGLTTSPSSTKFSVLHIASRMSPKFHKLFRKTKGGRYNEKAKFISRGIGD